jgi:CHAT domain-containing protein
VTCLDDEQLAAYVDRRVDATTRRTLEAHLAECSRCRDLLAETVAVLETDDQRARTLPMWRRTWPKVLIAAALAATILLAARVTFMSSRQAALDRPELAELVAAAAHEPTRLADGRLTGGFPYKPAPVATRGTERRVSPEVRIATARIEQAARGRDDAGSDAALGTSFLAVGDWDRAVEQLESAVEQAPDNARFQNDLAVAYIARASTTGRADDWPKAYAAAERAAKRDPQLIEPCFNRALALEGLTLLSEAVEAWTTCADRDRGSPWSAEARERAQAVRDRIDARKNQPRSRQQDREEIEDRVLVRWAEAEKAGAFAQADGALADGERMARALADTGGDTMARDEVRLIRRSPRGSRARADLVQAHLAYGRAREAFVAERLSDARTEMDNAADAFARAQSPYQYWAPIFRAIPLWIGGDGNSSLHELSSIPLERLPDSYYHLRGRVAWTKGMAFNGLGRVDVARNLFDEARHIFHRSGALEYEVTNTSYVAEAEWMLGNRQTAWKEYLASAAGAEHVGSVSRQSLILSAPAIAALDTGLPESALAFQQHVFRITQSEPHAQGAVDPTAYLRRGQIFGRLHDMHAASSDLRLAEDVVSMMPDPHLREWMVAEVNAARSELLAQSNPGAAIAAANVALDHWNRVRAPIRQSELFLARARARETRGDLDTAAEDYAAAISALERDEDGVAQPQQRKAAYDQQRSAVRETVRFHAIVRGDTVTALGIAERARARVLRQTLAGPTAPAPNPALVHRSLPRDLTVLYYVTLPDRILGWVLTCDQSFHFTRMVDARTFRHRIDRLQRRIDNDATIGDLASELQYLQSFIRPALSALTPGATLVVIPDEGLETIPFAAVPDFTGTPLIANYSVLLAPSYSTLLLASQRLAGFEPDGVVAIGDGHDPSDGLPRLQYADAEAEAVAHLYPRASVFTGSTATARHFLNASEPVLHFAGHTIANASFPFLSQLLFAPESPAASGTGILLASDIRDRYFSNTRVVVLASCQSAAGRFIPGEGVDNVARFLLDAGVPAVVASLWPVADDERSLLIEFHKQLRSTRDVARALRAAQVKEFDRRAEHHPLKRWAGFVAIGGTTSIWARKDANR